MGDMGGMAVILTLNYQMCQREILLHGCTYAVAAKQPPRNGNKPRPATATAKSTNNTTTAASTTAGLGSNDAPGGGGGGGGGNSGIDPPGPALKRLASITYPTGWFYLPLKLPPKLSLSSNPNPPSPPSGRYSLDLSVLAERTVIKELLRIATIKRGCELKMTYQVHPTPIRSYTIIIYHTINTASNS